MNHERSVLCLKAAVLLAAVLPLSYCATEKQGIRSAVFCDHYTDECRDPGLSRTDSYRTEVPGSGMRTWRDFAHYLYFHSRETPGLLVKFKVPLGREELTEIRKVTRCHYSLERNGLSARHEMEGIRFLPDGSGFWCFDYLGSMLIEYHKINKTLDEKPDLTEKDESGNHVFRFDLELTASGDIPWIRAGVRRSAVRLIWTEEKK